MLIRWSVFLPGAQKSFTEIVSYPQVSQPVAGPLHTTWRAPRLRRGENMFKICVVAGCMLFCSACVQSNLPWSVEKQRRFARRLQDKGMYAQAVNAYSELAAQGKLKSSEQAGAYYLAANICYENMRDYKKALQLYMRSEISGAKGKMRNTIDKRIIECLERLGKSYDAQKELDRRTRDDTNKPLSEETIVAVIGKRNISMQELNSTIRMLPAYVQKEYKTKEKKLAFLRQYIATELLYDSARRKGFEESPAIMKAAEQIKKNLMVEALLAEELSADIKVSETEIKLYHQAHPEEFNTQALGDVRSEVIARLTDEKKQDAYRALMDRLMKAEKVFIYEEYFAQK